MITAEKIKIYKKFGGLDDGFFRAGNAYEKGLFDNNEWHIISNYYQDIYLISNRQAAQSYILRTLEKMKEDCDNDAFILLTEKIPFYKYFQEIALILERIKFKITPESDTINAGYDNSDEFLEVLDNDIENIKNCDFEVLKKMNLYFAPTGKYQEISISNGWSDEFIELANSFDNAFRKLN